MVDLYVPRNKAAVRRCEGAGEDVCARFLYCTHILVHIHLHLSDNVNENFRSPIRRDDRRKDLFSLAMDDGSQTSSTRVGASASSATTSSGMELFPDAVLNEDLMHFSSNR